MLACLAGFWSVVTCWPEHRCSWSALLRCRCFCMQCTRHALLRLRLTSATCHRHPSSLAGLPGFEQGQAEPGAHLPCHPRRAAQPAERLGQPLCPNRRAPGLPHPGHRLRHHRCVLTPCTCAAALTRLPSCANCREFPAATWRCPAPAKRRTSTNLPPRPASPSLPAPKRCSLAAPA